VNCSYGFILLLFILSGLLNNLFYISTCQTAPPPGQQRLDTIRDPGRDAMAADWGQSPTFFDILQEKLRKQFAYSSITGIIARERVLLDKLELI